MAARNVLNSIRSTVRFSMRCSQRAGRLGHQQRGPRFQVPGQRAMTMYAQLLTRLSTGERQRPARRP